MCIKITPEPDRATTDAMRRIEPKRADIVDQGRTGIQGFFSDGGFGRVDREGNSCPSAKLPHDWQKPTALFLLIDRDSARLGRFRADIEQICALLDHGHRVCTCGVGIYISPAIRKQSRRHV